MKGIFAKKKEKTFHFYPRNNSSSFKKDGRVLLERAQGYSLNGRSYRKIVELLPFTASIRAIA